MKKLVLLALLSLTLMATTHTAKVLETLNSGGYTYMKVQDATNSYWIAMTQRAIHVGDKVSYTEQGWMQNFHSKTLNRTFDSILFAGDIATSPVQQITQQEPNIMTSSYQTKDTLTIAELFKNRDKYVGKTVIVRGKVTKTSTAIMKLNWVHIEDGSRFAGMDDLVFTTTQKTPKLTTIVYATGKLIKDKDFGYGYFYPVIIQEATFK